jgi:glycosyltransferase involved in cell wall biosynthesis
MGGMERVAFELCSRLLERGGSLVVIARSCALPAGPQLRFVRIRSPSRPVSVALIADFVFAGMALARHRRGIVQTNNATVPNRTDVIHAHFCERAFRATGISRGRHPGLLYGASAVLAGWFSLQCERWCYRPGRVRRIVCVSDGLASDTASFYPAVSEQVCSIPNGVDPSSFDAASGGRAQARRTLDLGEHELAALFVGGDWHRKGLRHAIDALGSAGGWTLVVVGEGDRETFGAIAAARGVEERVRFLGKVADPVPYYIAADALVAPSYYEGFSLSGAEAAAAGLPLIVPHMNGTEHLVVDGVNGWFTAREGEAIAERLRRLGEDKSLRERMSRAARKSVERFYWEGIVDRFEAFYAEMEEEPSQPKPSSCEAPQLRVSR